MQDKCDKKIYTVAEIKQILKLAVEKYHYTPYDLMVAAGNAVYRTVRHYWPAAKKITFVCGAGDNAANAYVTATAAVKDLSADLAVKICAAEMPQFSDPIAQQVFNAATVAGVPIQLGLPDLSTADLVVDAIFGNSLRQPIAASSPYFAFIDTINQQAKPVLAIDVPSGLNAETGIVEGTAVRATRTLTFIGIKVGMTINAGPEYCGDISCFDDNILEQMAAD